MAEQFVLVGDYGSGKTECAINLAVELAVSSPVILVDLDIVNPYFRSREAAGKLEAHRVEVVYNRAYGQADLPALSPRIDSALREDKTLILDVGGDDGSIVLGRYRSQLQRRQAEIWQVVNCMRPFTASAEGIIETAGRIEQKSGLKITALVNNTNLGRETEPGMVLAGAKTLAAAAGRLKIPLARHCARPHLIGQLASQLPRLLSMDISLFPQDIE